MNSIKIPARKLSFGAASAACTLASIFAFGVVAPASAAPLAVSQAAAENSVVDNVIDVRRRHRSRHAIPGVALGIIGSALAYKYYRDRHHYHGGYYAHPGYPYGYGCYRVHNHRNSVVSWRCR